MAVPGNITSALSEGTNNLIKAGATPVTSGEDILYALAITPQDASTEQLAANAEEAVILGLLQQGISESSELMRLSEFSAPVFNQTLTMLEITGKIRPLGAGHWATNN